tara:strand:+ start:762 stop:1694 length:933 start_codon:yes stop_codon:yes gene_type:complete
MAVIAAALIATAGAALNAKVAKNRANNPQDTVTAKAAGAGQAGGVPIDIEDIVGTEVSGEGITPFAYKPYDEAISEEPTEDEIRALLEEQGGIMSAASGKYLSRGTGGGITLELLQSLFPDSMGDLLSNNKSLDEIVASASRSQDIPMPEQQTGINSLDVNITSPEMPREMNMLESVQGFAETNPAIFNSLVKTLGDAINAKIKGAPKQATNLDSRVMAGNANRRAAQINFKPIGAKSGGVLDRKMFTPMLYGGELDGPGGPKEDLIPVMASDGEFMLSKAAVDQAGGGNHTKGIARLTAFNNKGNKRYG